MSIWGGGYSVQKPSPGPSSGGLAWILWQISLATNCIVPHSWILPRERERGGSEWYCYTKLGERRERERERERERANQITQCALGLDKNLSKHILPFSTADRDPLMVGQFALCTHNHHILWCLLLHKLSLLNFLCSSTTLRIHKEHQAIHHSILCAPYHGNSVCSTCIMHTIVSL